MSASINLVPNDPPGGDPRAESKPGISRIRVSRELLDRTLNCYLPSVRYLVGADLEFSDNRTPFATEVGEVLSIARGRFTTRTNWYIDDTGHFNAIEFNLCYNQLVYTLLAQASESHVIPEFSARIPASRFRERQLTDVLIRRYQVTFDCPMKVDHFVGVVAVRRVIARMGSLFLETHCRIGQEAGPWCARGNVTLAIVDSGQEP